MSRLHITGNRAVIILAILAGCILGGMGGAFFALTHDLPQIQALESFKPSSVTRMYASDGTMLAEIFSEKRDPIPLKKIPVYLKKAIVAIEDKSFYSHSGVDVKGIARAAIKDVMARKFVEGASTITQQLAKTLFLTPEKNFVRKIKEAILAFQMERRYTKDEILSLYLNQIYFGSGAYGVKAAAWIFFRKKVGDLTLAECALISGMPKSPSRYSPLVNPHLAVKRRNIVLGQMRKDNIISEEEFQEAKTKPLIVSGKRSPFTKAPYFVSYIKRHLEAKLGSAMIYRGGLEIYTTLDIGLQEAAEMAVSKRIRELEKRMAKKGLEDIDPQCAVISLDVKTGGILAMVGGKDYSNSSFNRAVSAQRQPGSAFKPIVYACAIESGFSQKKVILDTPVEFPMPGKKSPWKPENFSESYSGEMTLRKALTHSKNVPAVRLIEMLGASSVIHLAQKLGIESKLVPYLSLALGTSEVNLLELTSAYASFPNQGQYIKPFGVMEIRDRNSRLLQREKPEKKIALSRGTAAVITDMLAGVVKEGTGKKARILKRQVAGKTGTTNSYKDALFIGYSPQVATGVWVGQDNYHTLGKRETGAKSALPVWIDVMEKALSDRPTAYFDIPDNVVKKRMDPNSGRLSSAEMPGTVPALFIKGTEPH
jgi:penicillin-binding protein 1A